MATAPVGFVAAVHGGNPGVAWRIGVNGKLGPADVDLAQASIASWPSQASLADRADERVPGAGGGRDARHKLAITSSTTRASHWDRRSSAGGHEPPGSRRNLLRPEADVYVAAWARCGQRSRPRFR
jgi:hypothetical protein